MKQYWVYILASHKRVLYIGMTNNLARRIYEHRHKLIEGFTKRYNITQLVYFQETNDVTAAIELEKRLKGWTREKKLELIRNFNPMWRDFGDEILGIDVTSNAPNRSKN